MLPCAHIDPNEDNDVLGMCISLVQEARQKEATILRSHNQEPGAILHTTNGLADSIHQGEPSEELRMEGRSRRKARAERRNELIMRAAPSE